MSHFGVIKLKEDSCFTNWTHFKFYKLNLHVGVKMSFRYYWISRTCFEISRRASALTRWSTIALRISECKVPAFCREVQECCSREWIGKKVWAVCLDHFDHVNNPIKYLAITFPPRLHEAIMAPNCPEWYPKEMVMHATVDKNERITEKKDKLSELSLCQSDNYT